VNLIFFMTHPIFTPYYIIPIDMLSLWTLLFATLDLRVDKSASPLNRPAPDLRYGAPWTDLTR
jgi:hypothetical protein